MSCCQTPSVDDDEMKLLERILPIIPTDALNIVLDFASERRFRTRLYYQYVFGRRNARQFLLPSAMMASWKWRMIRQILYTHATYGYETWDAIYPHNAPEWCFSKLNR